MRAQPFEASNPTNTPIFIQNSQSLSPSPALQSFFAKVRCSRCLCNLGSRALVGTHPQRQSLTTTSILPSTTSPSYYFCKQHCNPHSTTTSESHPRPVIMDRADRLIDQDEAERNSFVQHHVVNVRGSLFPAQSDASRSKLDVSHTALYQLPGTSLTLRSTGGRN